MQRTMSSAMQAAAAKTKTANTTSAVPPIFRYLQRRVQLPNGFQSKVFPVEEIQLHDRKEQVLRGGRHLFPLLSQAFAGVNQIGVIGWGSQGPAQAQNLRESLEGTGIRVKVGLRPHSKSFEAAKQANFTPETNTLGDICDVISESDLSLVLISDAAMATEYKKIFSALKPNSYLGLSHGFLLGYLESVGATFPKDVGVIAVCPKGVGPSVRRLYEQGREINGAGINSSFAVVKDIDGRAVDLALGWSVAIGAPYTFQTTLDAEFKSDIFGERGILLGAAHGLCEVLYRYKVRNGATPEQAYIEVVEGIVRPISRVISKEGVRAVRGKFYGTAKDKFDRAYTVAYPAALEILAEIYDEVESRREIANVIDHVNRHSSFPFAKIDSSPLWKVAERVRPQINDENVPLCPEVAGFYVATMVAQCDMLRAAGHAYSEVANESVIEAVDSLNPYMRFKGVSYMVDNCSCTARLGSRKWAPRFDYIFEQLALPKLESSSTNEQLGAAETMEAFEANPIHDILAVCATMRPAVDIAPVTTHLG